MLVVQTIHRYSSVKLHFRRGFVNLDAALVSVSPPDQHGFCSLGTSVDCARAAVQHAKYIIGKYLIYIYHCFFLCVEEFGLE